jgi:hypothetical protein
MSFMRLPFQTATVAEPDWGSDSLKPISSLESGILAHDLAGPTLPKRPRQKGIKLYELFALHLLWTESFCKIMQ